MAQGYSSGKYLNGIGEYDLNTSTISTATASPCRRTSASWIASAAARCPPPVSDIKIRTRLGLFIKFAVSLACYPRFNRFFKLPTRKHDAALTAQTAHPNIRADTLDLP